jgi:adenosine deaminase
VRRKDGADQLAPEEQPPYRKGEDPEAGDFYRSLPKVELHRHLEGSLRLVTLLEVARAHGIDLLGTDRLRPLVQVDADDPLTSQNFLAKFATLRRFYRSPDVIARITQEAVADAAADNIRYLELRFTPAALSKAENFPLHEVIDWVIEGARQAEAASGVITRLIASVNRHESPELAAQVASLAVERRHAGIVGLDLAGNEASFPASPFAGIFREAREAGLNITVHAGEWGGAGNVAQAITMLHAQRIGHGVRVMEDQAVVALARERGTTFEVCITSNYQTGVVPALNDHPIRSMLAASLDVTLNTDDPSISQITLSDEYRLACEKFAISLAVLRERTVAAARAAFIPEAERQSLAAAIERDFPVRFNDSL